MNSIKLKALSKKLSNQMSIPPNIIQRHFMMDMLLKAISKSHYKDDFILKSGFLLGSKYGVGLRSTTDIDTTFNQTDLTLEKLTIIFSDVLNSKSRHNVGFKIASIKETREAFNYLGFKVSFIGTIDTMRVPFSMDITTGDSIIPDTIKHRHEVLFSQDTIEIPAYPPEQIIAEKLSATFDFKEYNSRMKDFYDLHTIPKFDELNTEDLFKSIRNTFNRRGKKEKLGHYLDQDMTNIATSLVLEKKWSDYQKTHSFASEITYRETVASIHQLMCDSSTYEKMTSKQRN